jgi:hypothetical protein
MKIFYHVTEKGNLKSIARRGLRAGYGDWGEGIYLWDDIYFAKKYVSDGGWDGDLEDPVIVKVETNEAIQGDIHPDWEEEREKYEHTWYVPIREGKFWKPLEIWVPG